MHSFLTCLELHGFLENFRTLAMSRWSMNSRRFGSSRKSRNIRTPYSLEIVDFHSFVCWTSRHFGLARSRTHLHIRLSTLVSSTFSNLCVNATYSKTTLLTTYEFVYRRLHVLCIARNHMFSQSKRQCSANSSVFPIKPTHCRGIICFHNENANFSK